MNLLTEFHEDRTINVASRVLTRFYYNHIRKNAPPLGSNVFQANITIFELIHNINKTNLLTIFHEDWTINVASRVLTKKNAPPNGGHVFQPKCIISELVQDIIGMNLLTMKNAPPLGSHFHEDRKINVASRVFTSDYVTVLTRKNAPPPGGHFHEDWTINVASKEKCPALGSHVFQAKVTILKLIQDIIGTNLLSKFHEDRKINVASRVKNASPPGSHVFHPTGIIFELFHEDQTINVASRVKNAPPLGSNVFQASVTFFELVQDIIETNLLTKFHVDWTMNVASIELTRQMLTAHEGQKAITKAHHEHIVLR
ncbi:hypothetical protein DPMN_018268 [Dreissena polymorpha]|uniref:Uncharacterized protein n=1 Tax=Dreissena polymorpha TaxID=45954 RepID=A0A9D4NET3_DREPO|nr:hypothetical protein DPMN_018268 [Dreissena polymorpha]